MAISTGWENNEDIVGINDAYSEPPKPDTNKELLSVIADFNKGNGDIQIIVTESMFSYHRSGSDINISLTITKMNQPCLYTRITIDSWVRTISGVGKKDVITCLALMMECLVWARDDIMILLHAANDGRWNLFSMWLDNATLTEMQEHKRL